MKNSFPASDLSRYYDIHDALLQPMLALEPNYSIEIQKGLAGNTGREVSLDLLRDLCGHYSKGVLAFAIIDHGSSFEVTRLKDNACLKTFYKHTLTKDKIPEVKKALSEKIAEFIKSINEISFEKLQRYDKSYTAKMKIENVFNYVLIQRRFGAALNKAEGESSNETIRTVLIHLCEENLIREVDKEVCLNTFKTKATLYKVVDSNDMPLEMYKEIQAKKALN